jgi:hypothetical protein
MKKALAVFFLLLAGLALFLSLTGLPVPDLLGDLFRAYPGAECIVSGAGIALLIGGPLLFLGWFSLVGGRGTVQPARPEPERKLPPFAQPKRVEKGRR